MPAAASLMEDHIIPHPMYVDYVADAIGRKFEMRSKIVHEKGKVVGPIAGLLIPLEWRFSHGHAEKDYFVICWKVSGQLYISVAFEYATRTTTVMLIDKSRLEAAFPKTNLVSASTRGSSAGKFRNLDGYVDWFKSVIVGVWIKSGVSAEYTKVAL